MGEELSAVIGVHNVASGAKVRMYFFTVAQTASIGLRSCEYGRRNFSVAPRPASSWKPRPPGFVGAKIVEQQDIARLQAWRESVAEPAR